MRHLNPLEYVYCVLKSPEISTGRVDDADVIGMTWLDPVEKISPEIRCDISPNVSRLIMRSVRSVIPADGCRGEPAVVYSWECLDVELAVKRGFVKLFTGWNPVKRSEVVGIRREFWLKCKPHFKVRK